MFNKKMGYYSIYFGYHFMLDLISCLGKGGNLTFSKKWEGEGGMHYGFGTRPFFETTFASDWSARIFLIF